MDKEIVEAIDDLCKALEDLAYGCLLTVGAETTSKVLGASVRLRSLIINKNVIKKSSKTKV